MTVDRLGACCCGVFFANAAGEGACGFGIAAGVGAGVGASATVSSTTVVSSTTTVSSGAGAVACSVISVVFSGVVTFSSAMASSLGLS